MRKTLSYILVTNCVLLLTNMFACSPLKVYRLPVSTTMAPKTFPAIASVASNMGLQYSELNNSVYVKLDDATSVYYEIHQDMYDMVIRLDDDRVPESDREARFAEAKQKADQIWQQAVTTYKNIHGWTYNKT